MRLTLNKYVLIVTWYPVDSSFFVGSVVKPGSSKAVKLLPLNSILRAGPTTPGSLHRKFTKMLPVFPMLWWEGICNVKCLLQKHFHSTETFWRDPRTDFIQTAEGAQYGNDPVNHEKGPSYKIDCRHQCVPKTKVLQTDNFRTLSLFCTQGNFNLKPFHWNCYVRLIVSASSAPVSLLFPGFGLRLAWVLPFIFSTPGCWFSRRNWPLLPTQVFLGPLTESNICMTRRRLCFVCFS